MSRRHADLTNDLDALLAVMPPTVRDRINDHPERETLLEVVLDLGRIPEARFLDSTLELSDTPVEADDIDHVVAAVGQFGVDNRAGIERTLHRISALRNRLGDVIGLTCRVGRALVGTVDIVRDVIETGRSVLLLGRPGVGKTTLLREAARVLADELGKRVVVVDTSNEIAGDGDIPHSGIGRARRMQVPSPTAQHAVMIEAVENHMPEVIVIDEIGTEAEASAARTIAERGVQLVATAHGNALENLLQNPTLSDLIGGIQAVTLSDDEARRRGTQKTVLERKAPATFDVLIEIQNKDRFAIHHQVTEVVDRSLRGLETHPEIRQRTEDGEVAIQPAPVPLAVTALEPAERGEAASPRSPHTNGRPGRDQKPRTPVGRRAQRVLRIHPYAVSRNKIQRAITDLGAKARLTTDLRETDLILTIKNQVRRLPPRMHRAQERGVRLGVVKSNTLRQIVGFIKSEMKLPDEGVEHGMAIQEVEQAVDLVLDGGPPAELSPQARHLRQLQHELIQSYGLTSTSTGHEPNRRVVIFPN